MKKVALLFVAVALTACASDKENVVSTDTNWLRIGEEPQGYPRMFVEASNGFCAKVTESWNKGSFKGQDMWLKQQSRISIACP